MSSGYESMLREAISGLGSYSKLPNGNFRLQAPSGQTCAVYFSGNVPGNAVDIDFSAKALALILGRTEAEIAEWVAAKAAQAGRERIVSGLRGKCPGLAVGSGGELQEFLLAWAEFTRRHVQGEVLETTRVEKAAQDAGFDLTPAREGNWMILRSSALPQTLVVLAEPGGGYGVGFSVAAWGRKVPMVRAMFAHWRRCCRVSRCSPWVASPPTRCRVSCRPAVRVQGSAGNSYKPGQAPDVTRDRARAFHNAYRAFHA